MNARIDRRRFVAAAVAGAAGLRGSASSWTAAGARAAPTPVATPGAGDNTTIIADVTVIDMTGAPPRPHANVVIEGERIAAIAAASAGQPPAGARVVDGAGRFLVPGLWDAHVHAFVFPWQPDLYFPLLLANGVTGVRDMGGAFPFPEIDGIRRAIASGARLGPRIVAGIMVDGPIPVWPFSLRAGTADEGRQAVATVAEARADFVKVYTLLPRDAYFAIAEAANARHLPFLGHVPIAVTAAEASDAGQRTIEHYSDSLLPYCSSDETAALATLRAAAAGPDPVQAYAAAFFGTLPQILATFDPAKAAALAARFAGNGTWFTPTLIIGRNTALAGDPNLTDDPRLHFLPPEIVAAWNAAPAPPPELRTIAQQSVDVGETITATMQRAGVELLGGTDLGLPYVVPGFSLHDELALLVAAGLSPHDALQAATRNAARAVGLGDALGTIEVGKLADLVLLDADPLADIANTTRIAAVVTNGRLLARPALNALLRTAEAATPEATPAP